ncbi:hypothetical protein G9A89_017281 [Geosiphon pyriformis]|nr:hypothetical protein G9A89_017281 [Geosiphon pyriformis]
MLTSKTNSPTISNNDQNKGPEYATLMLSRLQLPHTNSESPQISNSGSYTTLPSSSSSGSSKPRQIAPAPVSPIKKSDYDIYHVPRGFEVVLVPKGSANNSASAAAIPINPISPVSSSSSDTTKPIKIPTNNSKNSLTSSWRRRKDSGHIPRPKNCFMAYREQIQHDVLKKHPGLNNKIVSVMAAQSWNGESEDVKQHWREVAKKLKAEHQMKYPNYKFAPKKKPGKTVGNVISKSNTSSMNSSLRNDNHNFLKPDDRSHQFSQTLLHADASISSHYRTPSAESSASWTSDSSTNTNSALEYSSPRSYSPPLFDVEHFHRSPSPLRFESSSSQQPSSTSTTPPLHNQQLKSGFTSPATSFTDQLYHSNFDLEMSELHLEQFIDTMDYESHSSIENEFGYQDELPYSGFLNPSSSAQPLLTAPLALNALQGAHHHNRHNNNNNNNNQQQIHNNNWL